MTARTNYATSDKNQAPLFGTTNNRFFSPLLVWIYGTDNANDQLTPLNNHDTMIAQSWHTCKAQWIPVFSTAASRVIYGYSDWLGNSLSALMSPFKENSMQTKAHRTECVRTYVHALPANWTQNYLNYVAIWYARSCRISVVNCRHVQIAIYSHWLRRSAAARTSQWPGRVWWQAPQRP